MTYFRIPLKGNRKEFKFSLFCVFVSEYSIYVGTEVECIV